MNETALTESQKMSQKMCTALGDIRQMRELYYSNVAIDGVIISLSSSENSMH